MNEPQVELAALSAALRERLERARRRGETSLLISVEHLLMPAPPPTVPPGTQSPAPQRAPAASAPDPSPSRGKKLALLPAEPERPDHPDRARRLGEMAALVSGCRKCGLCETRTQTVFARGTGRSSVMFIGEAPGADEDRQGLPFVGRAGQLLDQIIDAAGFDRETVYVANILKCRPPGNRDPRPEETAACTGYLEAQIELVNPKIICALGRHAAQFLTGKPDAAMGQLRGKIHYYRDRIMVLPTYHPAALLRNPEWKRVVWEDMQTLRQEYLR